MNDPIEEPLEMARGLPNLPNPLPPRKPINPQKTKTSKKHGITRVSEHGGSVGGALTTSRPVANQFGIYGNVDNAGEGSSAALMPPPPRTDSSQEYALPVSFGMTAQDSSSAKIREFLSQASSPIRAVPLSIVPGQDALPNNPPLWRNSFVSSSGLSQIGLAPSGHTQDGGSSKSAAKTALSKPNAEPRNEPPKTSLPPVVIDLTSDAEVPEDPFGANLPAPDSMQENAHDIWNSLTEVPADKALRNGYRFQPEGASADAQSFLMSPPSSAKKLPPKPSIPVPKRRVQPQPSPPENAPGNSATGPSRALVPHISSSSRIRGDGPPLADHGSESAVQHLDHALKGLKIREFKVGSRRDAEAVMDALSVRPYVVENGTHDHVFHLDTIGAIQGEVVAGMNRRFDHQRRHLHQNTLQLMYGNVRALRDVQTDLQNVNLVKKESGGDLTEVIETLRSTELSMIQTHDALAGSFSGDEEFADEVARLTEGLPSSVHMCGAFPAQFYQPRGNELARIVGNATHVLLDPDFDAQPKYQSLDHVSRPPAAQKKRNFRSSAIKGTKRLWSKFLQSAHEFTRRSGQKISHPFGTNTASGVQPETAQSPLDSLPGPSQKRKHAEVDLSEEEQEPDDIAAGKVVGKIGRSTHAWTVDDLKFQDKLRQQLTKHYQPAAYDKVKPGYVWYWVPMAHALRLSLYQVQQDFDVQRVDGNADFIEVVQNKFRNASPVEQQALWPYAVKWGTWAPAGQTPTWVAKSQMHKAKSLAKTKRIQDKAVEKERRRVAKGRKKV